MTLRNDDNYHLLIETGSNQFNNSDVDALKKKVKRNNLVEFFLRGTEVDNYLAANFYGKQRFKNIHDESIGEQTIIENLDLNETF